MKTLDLLLMFFTGMFIGTLFFAGYEPKLSWSTDYENRRDCLFYWTQRQEKISWGHKLYCIGSPLKHK